MSRSAWSRAGVMLVPLSWLVPNHYFPWASAWAEFLTIAAVVVAYSLGTRRVFLAIPLCLWAAIGFCIVGLQFASGQLAFLGDWLVVVLYLAALLMAIAIGSRGDPERNAQQPNVLVAALAVGAVAIASVGVALVQWTGAIDLGVWGVDMPAGGRPFGNVAQPNHLCTIAFLGLCSLALLRERSLIGLAGFVLGTCWMLMGMVMTASRTGWLQFAALLLMSLALAKRSGTRVGPGTLLVFAVVYALGVGCWSILNDALLMLPARTGAEVVSGGTRPLHWAAMMTAIAQQPWFGYGWQQVSVAQVQTAELQPHVGEYIEHSHNLFLDLLVWNGVPAGLLLIGILVWWYASRLLRCRDATVFWLLACVTTLAAHAMVEYPLSFAYFLVPMGLWIGAIDALQGQGPRWAVSARVMQASGLLFAGLLGWVAVDYLKAEQSYRLLRLESARIGTTGLTTPPPDLQLLTQLEAFQRFAHTQARAGMTAAELDAMRKVTERYAYPPSMFRYALAQGLNGHPDGAALTLLRLCRIHPRPRCEEGRQAWVSLQQQHAALRAIAFPTEAQVHVLK